MMRSVETQLVLIETEPSDWRLDEHTREVGRKGIESARAALAAAHRARHDARHDAHNEAEHASAA
jgi:hypothetical protein